MLSPHIESTCYDCFCVLTQTYTKCRESFLGGEVLFSNWSPQLVSTIITTGTIYDVTYMH